MFVGVHGGTSELLRLLFQERKRGQGGRERKVVKQGGRGGPAGLNYWGLVVGGRRERRCLDVYYTTYSC